MSNPPLAFRGRPISGLVTVITPFFNREKFLPETIGSLFRQSHSKLQLILVDDGSTDRSFSLAQSFRDPRILLIRSRKQRGKPHAVNEALRFAQGEWITFFDSDDLMVPRSLEIRVDFLRRNPRALAVMGRVGRIIDESGKPLSPSHPIHAFFRSSLRTTRQLTQRIGSLLPELFVYGQCPLSPLSVTLFRRKAVQRVGLLDKRCAPWEDRDYLMRTAFHQPVPFLDVPVMWYRVHGNNLSFRTFKNRLFHPDAASLKERLRARYREFSRDSS
jgi:alpha-1,6-rhamnosyltransferase